MRTALLRVALAATVLTVAIASSPLPTRSSTKTGTPSISSPTQTPSTSPVPSLTAEQWGYLDTSVPAPTLQPIILYRSSIDGQLYAQLHNVVPPSGPFATTAADLWLAWNASTPYPNVASQGSKDPAGDNNANLDVVTYWRCVVRSCGEVPVGREKCPSRPGTQTPLAMAPSADAERLRRRREMRSASHARASDRYVRFNVSETGAVGVDLFSPLLSTTFAYGTAQITSWGVYAAIGYVMTS